MDMTITMNMPMEHCMYVECLANVAHYSNLTRMVWTEDIHLFVRVFCFSYMLVLLQFLYCGLLYIFLKVVVLNIASKDDFFLT